MRSSGHNKATGKLLIHGVLQYDGSHESAAQVLAQFTSKKVAILEAVLRAFQYRPRFTNEFDFEIEISENADSSRSEKAKLAVDLMKELGAAQTTINQFIEDMMTAMQNGMDHKVVCTFHFFVVCNCRLM